MKIRFCLILGWLMTAQAISGGFSSYQVGARGTSAAGAFTARAEDGSALFFNPAGLARVTQEELSFDLPVLLQSGYYSNIGQSTWSADRTREVAPQVIFNMKWHDWGFAVGNTTSYFHDIDWKDRDFPGRFLSSGSRLRGDELAAGIAYALGERFSLGATFRYVRLEKEWSQTLPGLLEQDTTWARVAEIEENGKEDGDGFGFTLGLQYYQSIFFCWGLQYRSETEIDTSGHADYGLATYADDPMAQSLLDSEFTRVNTTSTTWLPQAVTFGIARKTTVRTRVEIDLGWENWSAWNGTTTAPSGFPRTPLSYNDTWNLRIGGDFFQRRNLTWSLGLATTFHVVPDEALNPAWPDADQFMYGLGVSYDWNEFTFEMGFLYTQYRDRTVEAQEYQIGPDPDTLLFETGQQGLYETQKHRLVLSVKRKF